jgi:hypothetical protein
MRAGLCHVFDIPNSGIYARSWMPSLKICNTCISIKVILNIYAAYIRTVCLHTILNHHILSKILNCSENFIYYHCTNKTN